MQNVASTLVLCAHTYPHQCKACVQATFLALTTLVLITSYQREEQVQLGVCVPALVVVSSVLSMVRFAASVW